MNGTFIYINDGAYDLWELSKKQWKNSVMCCVVYVDVFSEVGVKSVSSEVWAGSY
jgi:hypothetical protein